MGDEKTAKLGSGVRATDFYGCLSNSANTANGISCIIGSS
jgi:hypothetical protein